MRRTLSENAQAVLEYIVSVYEDGSTIAGQMDLTWKPEIDMHRKYSATLAAILRSTDSTS